jgi:small subunit ribosomal protein S6e
LASRITFLFCSILQRKRHRMALKKKRVVNRREQAAEYARLLALRTKEAKVKRAEEVKRRRSRSASKSSVGTQ